MLLKELDTWGTSIHWGGCFQVPIKRDKTAYAMFLVGYWRKMKKCGLY